MGPGQLPLHVQQERAHSRNGGHVGGISGDFVPADRLGHIGARQVHVLKPVLAVAQVDVDGAEQLRDMFRIGGIHAVLENI
jgi:hypothetical protein